MDTKANILIIDDELSPRESIRMVLSDKYNVSTATGGHEGLEFMHRHHVDLVVLDIMMPGMDGITTMKEIKKRYPETEVILLTAFASIKTAKSAVRYGAHDYLTKPFDKDDILKVVERGLNKKHTRVMLKLETEKLIFQNMELEEQVDQAKKNIVRSYEETVKALIKTIDAKDHYTSSHSEHVAGRSIKIAKIIGLSEDEIAIIHRAANMHDIGKIGIDEAILRKNGPLNDEEFREMKKHPGIGTSIVQQVQFLTELIPVILHHHERYDGKGYPYGLKGDEIPVEARIVSISDAVDAMQHARPYRGSLPREKILQELDENAGTQFDPVIVDMILKEKIEL